MPNLSTSLLLLTVILIALPQTVTCFGAGDIPDFAYLNDKAFRHGDIENILETVLKNSGRISTGAAGGGLLAFAKHALQSASGGSKFNKEDIKKIYFGNWLRDYSQAMDIAGLSKLTADTLVLVVSVLGFMTFGFATEEFEVTADRLAVYLPVEHIDNPKGYAEKEGDARQFHPKLRPPVDPRELEIDPRTGMKNYMATENQSWDSSTAHIRRTFQACIDHGRRAQGSDGSDLWEAYRLLGTGLHTMEDLLAHSNWCEIALRKMGHSEVFCHVGDNVEINTPNGRAPPLVTGTFGSADFLHSLLGEATDHLSQASVTALSQKMSEASNDPNASGNMEKLKAIFSKLPIGGGDAKINEAEQLQQESAAYDFDPNAIPPEIRTKLLQVLTWHDSTFRWITEKLKMVPGLSSLLDELANSLNAYVYTVIAPWLTPILSQATSVLGEGSKAVIASDDQYEVFDDPHASDPSHSLLSKDHFGLILNEPAGKIAQIVVVYSTELIVKAWFDDSNPIDQILEAFHHPYFADRRSSIQHRMFEEMERWIGGLGPDEASQTIQALTKESVREGKNKRLGDGGEGQVESGYGGSTSLSLGSGNYGGNRTEQYVNASSYSRNEGIQEQPQYGASSQRNEEYGNDQPQGYGRTQYESTNSSRGDSYGRSEGYSGRQQTYSGQSGYSDRNPNRYDEEPRRSRRGREEQDNSSYGPKTDSRSESENAHGSRREENAYQYQSGGYKPDPEPYERQGDYDYGREQGGYRQEDRGGTGYGGDRPHGRRHDFSEDRYGSGQGGQYESRGSEYQDQSYGRREAGYVEEDYSRGESQEYKENRETGYEGDQYHY